MDSIETDGPVSVSYQTETGCIRDAQAILSKFLAIPSFDSSRILIFYSDVNGHCADD